MESRFFVLLVVNDAIREYKVNNRPISLSITESFGVFDRDFRFLATELLKDSLRIKPIIKNQIEIFAGLRIPVHSAVDAHVA